MDFQRASEDGYFAHESIVTDSGSRPVNYCLDRICVSGLTHF